MRQILFGFIKSMWVFGEDLGTCLSNYEYETNTDWSYKKYLGLWWGPRYLFGYLRV